MKRFILCLLMLISFSYADKYYDQYLKDIKKLDDNQVKVIKQIYERTKAFDLVFTALAISWQESNFGKWNINLQDPSCGPFQQSVFHYMRKYKIQMTDFNINKVCSELMNNIDLSTATFISEIEMWSNVHKKRWNKWEYVFRSYNAGNNYNSNTAKVYAEKVKSRIRVLKKVLPSIESIR